MKHFSFYEEFIEMQLYMYICLNVKHPFFFARFWLKLKFLDIFSKNTQISNFMNIRPTGAEVFNADGWTNRQRDKENERQTDRHDKANSRFQNFCERA